MWAEQIDPVNFDKQAWPRAAAAAEVLWSGAKDASGQNRSQIEASPRLSEFRERLVARGVGAEPIQMPVSEIHIDRWPQADSFAVLHTERHTMLRLRSSWTILTVSGDLH